MANRAGSIGMANRAKIERIKQKDVRQDDVPDPMNASDAPIHESQTEAAVSLIRSRIIDLTLEPGSRIDEPLLIDTFKLGRTPAREAMNRLVAEGFVTTLPRRGGSYVRRLDLREIGEVVVAHQTAETVLGQMLRFGDPTLLSDLHAIQESYVREVRAQSFLHITALNEAFHLRMHRAVDNSFINAFAESTHRHVRRLLVLLYKLEADEPGLLNAEFEQNLEQHEAIIATIGARDRNALVELLRSHARHTQTRIVKLLEAKAVAPFALDMAPEAADPGAFSREFSAAE
jgi:DNA-binding GntR family transcriptional regulator